LGRHSKRRAAGMTMRGNIRELPPHAWFLIGGSFINRFGTFVVPFLVLYLKKKGFGTAQAGAAVAAYGLGEVIAGGVGGYLADRIGRRATIVLSTFSSAVAMLVLSQAGPYWSILGLAFLAGLVSEARRPASLALLTDLVPEGRRVTVFALVRVVENVAFAGGIVAGGLLANHSFLLLFVGDAATSAAYGLIALFVLPEGRRTSAHEERAHGGYKSILEDRAFVLFLLATILLAFVYFQQQATLPLHVRRYGLSPGDFGLLLAVNGVLVTLFELPISSLTMRRPGRQMIALGFLLVGLGFGLTAFAHTLPTLMATVAIWTVGEMVAAPVSYAYVANIAPEHMRGRYQGLYGTFFGSGAVFGPALGTAIFAITPGGFWAVCGGVGLASALLLIWIPPTKRHAVIRVPEPVSTVATLPLATPAAGS
jgi:MFS family permease